MSESTCPSLANFLDYEDLATMFRPIWDSEQSITEMVVTLRPVYYRLKPEAQYELLDKKVRRGLKKYNISGYFISEYTEHGNVHLHGFTWGNSHGRKEFIHYCKRNMGWNQPRCIISEGLQKTNIWFSFRDRFEYVTKNQTECYGFIKYGC